MTAIALQHRKEVIQRISAGETLDKIADSLGVAAPNISKHLATDPEYQAARELGTELRLLRSTNKLASVAAKGFDQQSGEPIGLSKAQGNLARVIEAELRANQWFAEREFPDRWGQRQQSSGGAGVQIVIGINRKAPQQSLDSKANVTVQCSDNLLQIDASD